MTSWQRVRVGSTNAVKVQAVREAFNRIWPDQKWDVSGRSVESGVSDQPMTEDETVAGARNRAQAVREQGEAEYYVGIEGGLSHAAGHWMECGWVVVIDDAGADEGLGASPKIMLPDKFYELLQTGATLNDACEKFLGVKNVGESIGYFGLMTNSAVTRQRAYVDAVSFALARFVHPKLFV